MDETRPLADEAESTAAPAVAGTARGRYVLVRRLGAGGCGEVFVAYDPVLDRRVALKVLFGEGGSAWAREARMLAKVEHPHVVTVYDAGVEDGRGFLATEFVDGPDLARWLEDREARVEPAALLALLLPVGRALAAAHEAGVVHGDVKPANILMASGGARITDFGVARAVGLDQPEDAVWAGTPAYMAPEQLEGSPSDERSDQYAFCLTVWEVLYGAPASALEPTEDAAGTTQISLAARGTPDSLATIAALAEARGQAPAEPPAREGLGPEVARALRRGLDPDPSRRFASMHDLVDALAVQPKASGAGLVLASVAAVGLAAGVGYFATRPSDVCSGADAAIATAWSPERRAAVRTALAGVSLPIAEAEADTTVEALDRYAAAWARQHTEICTATSVRKEQSAAVMDRQMQCMMRARSTLQATAEVLQRADATVVRRAARIASGMPPLQRCLDAEQLDRDAPPPVPEGHADTVAALREQIARAHALRLAGRAEESRALAADVVDDARPLDYPPVLVAALLRLAYAHVELGADDDARTALREAIDLGIRRGPTKLGIEAASLLTYVEANSPGDPLRGEGYGRMALALIQQADPRTELHSGILSNLGVVRARAAEYAAARSLFAEAHAILEARLGEEHPRVIDMLDNLASVDLERRDMQAAQAGYERALALREAAAGPGHFSTIMPLNALGAVHGYQGQFEESVDDYQRALQISREALGPRSPEAADALVGLANSESKLGRFDDAAAHIDEALAILREVHGEESQSVADALIVRGQLEFVQGRYAQAEPFYVDALRITKAVMPATHPQRAVCAERVALVNMGLGRWAKAEAHFTQALQTYEAAGLDPAVRSISLGQRGSARIELGQVEGAVDDLTAAAQLQRERPGPAHPDDILTYNLLGRAAAQLGRDAVAREAFIWAIELSESLELLPGDLAEARAGLAMLDGARDRLRTQLKVLEAAGPDWADATTRARAFLEAR